MKQCYIGNISYVLAETEYKQRSIDPSTSEGIYNATLERTGNKDLASRVQAEARSHIEMKRAMRNRPKG